MSKSETRSQESIDKRAKRANWEAIVATDGVINVCNYSEENPSAHSVFVDELDREAVSCSCTEWKLRKPSDGCDHLKFVRGHESLIEAAMSPQR